MKPRLLLGALLTATALASPALAQNQPLFATGALTPGHALVLQQAGTPGSAVTKDGGPAIAGGFTEIGLTNDGLPLCVRDKAQQHLICFGANAFGGGLISYNPIGSGTPLPLQINLNGQFYPFPGAGNGNVLGPNSSTVGHIALFNNTGGTLLADSGPNFTFSSNVLTVGDPTNGGYQPHNPSLPLAALVSATGAVNGIIGQTLNNTPYTTTPFIAVGVAGYGKVPAGITSVVQGVYGLGEIFNSLGEITGGEVTARNFGGGAANNGVPPPTGSPTGFLIVDGFHITCGSQQVGESDCSTGLYITNESGGSSVTDPSFANGIVVNGYRQFGLYIAPGYPTGSQISAEIDNNGNDFNLLLKTTGAMTAGNAVFEVVDNAAAVHAVIRQNGDALFNNVELGQPAEVLFGSQVALNSPGANSVGFAGDAGWTSISLGNGTADVAITGTLKTGTFTGTTCTNDGSITIKDSGGTPRKVMICS